jgi:hypothetical protein
MRRRQVQAEWSTGVIPDRTGLAAFTEVIRYSGDPERTSREKHRALHGPDATTRWKRDLKGHPSVWGPRLVELLRDRQARTLNRIGVELVDFGADTVMRTALNEALWALVEAGAVEHTIRAPIFFRWRGEPEREPDYEKAAKRARKFAKEDKG